MERAIRYRPNFAPHLYDYALPLWSGSEFQCAEEPVRAALQPDSQMAETHALLGGLVAGKRQLAETAGEYREAFRMRPSMARTRLDLASVLAAEALKRLGQ